MQAWCKVCYLCDFFLFVTVWSLVCVAGPPRAAGRPGGGAGAPRRKKEKKSTPSGTRIRRICLEGRSVTLTPMASFSRAQHRWVRSDES